MFKSRFALLCLFLAGCAGSPMNKASAENLQIENPFNKIVFNATAKTLTVSSKVKPVEFIRGVQFADPVQSGKITAVNDPAFGKGQTLELATSEGNVNGLTLFDGFPFVVIQSTLQNGKPETQSWRRYSPFTLDINPGHSIDSLKSLGSGGLSGVDKESNPGSYVFLSIVEPESRNGVVAAWLTHERASGVLFPDHNGENVSLKARLDFGHLQLKSRQTENLDTFVIGYFEDARLGLEAYADAVAKKLDIHLKPQPTVYCTWYHAGASDEKDLLENAKFARENLKPYGFSVVQIDDKWQEGEKLNGPRKNFSAYDKNGPYPSGMKATADNIKRLGLVPGIWFMPFAGTHKDPWFADKQYLFATKDGEPFETNWAGSCFDLTNPKTQQYVYDIAHRIAHDWGYEYFKMDGLMTGCAVELNYVNDMYKEDNFGETTLFDPTMTHIEAYRTGFKTVRKAAGDDVFFLGCNIPQNMRSFGAAMGMVDAMRIGPDNKRIWESMCRGPRFGSRVYFLHRRVWYNDPDPIYMRQRDVPLKKAQSLCSWVALTGQLNASSTDYTKLSPERLHLLQRTMPAHDLMPRPVDLFEEEIPRIWLLHDDRSGTERNVVGLFNWDGKKSATIEYPMERIGLDGKTSYVGFDYWGNRFVGPFEGHIKASLSKAGCQILSLRPVSDKPQLLGTSRHITQGVIDVKEEHWDNDAKILSGTSEVVGGDPYELRIVAMKGNSYWTMASTAVSDDDDEAGVSIRLASRDGIYVRLLIESKESRPVKWKITFR